MHFYSQIDDVAIQRNFHIKNARFWDYLHSFNRSFSVFGVVFARPQQPCASGDGPVQVADGRKSKKKGPMRAKPGPKLENYRKNEPGTSRPTQAWARQFETSLRVARLK